MHLIYLLWVGMMAQKKGFNIFAANPLLSKGSKIPGSGAYAGWLR
jgi:hypothetical protein